MRRIPDRCHVTYSHLCDTCRARHLQLGPIFLPKYTSMSNSCVASCRFSSHKTPPYLIAPLKRTRRSSLQLICLVSLQLVKAICWRCIYKLKALRFRHTPCSSGNEHIFSSVLFIYFLLAGVELISRSSKGEQELVKMSRVMSELFYGRPVDSYYPGSASHYYPQTMIPHGTTRPLLPDVQFRVPMESRRDVEKVKDALDLEGVHAVVCDLPSQTVTVSGNVPFHRLLKKLKHVKRKSKLLSFSSPDSPYSPSYGHETFGTSAYNSSAYVVPSSSYGSGRYGAVSVGSASYMRAPFSPPHSYGSSYVREAYERPYYEDYEDYRSY